MSNRISISAKKWIRRIVSAIALLIAAIWLFQGFVLPSIVENLVRDGFASYGYTDATMRVEHASFTGTTIRELHSPAGLDIAILHVSYSPAALLAGRVDEIVIDDVFVKAQAYRPNFSAPSTAQPPFRNLTIERGSVELPTPAGPVTARVSARTRSQRDRRLLVTAEGSVPGVRVQAKFDADPELTRAKVFGRVDADLAAIIALLNRDDLSIAGQLMAEASGTVNLQDEISWELPEVHVDVDATSVSASAADVRAARVVLLGAASGRGKKVTARLLSQSEVTAESIGIGEKLPPFALALRPKQIELRRDEDAWEITSGGAALDVGDLSLGVEASQVRLAEGRFSGQIAAAIDLAQLGQSRLLQSIFPLLADMQLGGKAQLILVGSAEQESPGEDSPSLVLRITDGTVASQVYELSARRIESQLVLVDLASPHTPPGQQLTMEYGQMGKWEVRDAVFRYTLENLHTLKVEHTELGWLGGRLWADPFTLDLASPVVRSRVHGEELDLGKLVWIVTGEQAWAEGTIDLDVPLAFSWPRMRFGDGFIAARPGGKLHLDFVADRVGDYLAATDPRFVTDPTYSVVRERVIKALREFRFSRLRLDMKRNDQQLDTLVQVQGRGDYEGGQEVNLNVTVSDLDWLISRYLAMPTQVQAVQE